MLATHEESDRTDTVGRGPEPWSRRGNGPFSLAACFAVLVILAACATPSPPTVESEGTSSRNVQQEAQKAQHAVPEAKRLKRKIAIGRFSNEAGYGRVLWLDEDGDPLGKQALDILSNRLVESGGFLVFERPDLGKIELEQQRLGGGDLIGVDVLILGSITEFARSTTGQAGFLSSTKKQLARAKVDIRLVDVRTGRVLFATSGVGEATMESGEIAGFGSRAAYDATLNDKALAAAINETVNGLVTRLEDRPWRTDILKVEENRVFISGGKRQGLEVGDELVVMQQGEQIKSGQTGMTITLPGTPVGRIQVVALFGDDEANEGSVATVTQGSSHSWNDRSSVYVTEAEQ
jgi:curli biogenesis system outer membrane secretion channel CsgG